MKAYVIKNEEGEYFCGFDGLAGVNIFSNKINLAISRKPTKKRCLEEIKEYHLKGCKIVPITIAEGDLEEKVSLLKKTLESVCCGYVEPNVYGTDIWEEAEKCGGLEQYFIQQTEESEGGR